MQQRSRRSQYRAVALVALAAAVVTTVPALASGERDSAEQPVATPRAGVLAPAQEPGARTVGGHTGDYNGDRLEDVLARDATTGDLKAYRHSGSYQGTGTYLPPDVVNNGWFGSSAIVPGKFTSQRVEDGLSDLVGIRSATGELLLATHSGAYGGPATFGPFSVIGTGWTSNDLVFAYDYNGDAYSDLIARRAGTGDTYLYRNKAAAGPGFEAPELVVQGGASDVWQAMADVTGDTYPDLIFAQGDGVLGAYSFKDNKTYIVGHGWNGIDAIVLTDVNTDGRPDLLGRRADNGTLQAYVHSGTWNPTPTNTAYDTYRAPAAVGHNWHVNDWIS